MLDFSSLLILSVVEKFDSIVTLRRFASTNKSIRKLIQTHWSKLLELNPQSPQDLLLELTYAAGLRRLIEPSLPVFVFHPICPADTLSSFLHSWLQRTPVELLMRRNELIQWSRKVAPNRFAATMQTKKEDLRDAANLVFALPYSSDLFFNIVRTLASPDNVELFFEPDFQQTLLRSRQVHNLSEIHEVCLQTRTLSELWRNLDRKVPLKIDMYEIREDRVKPVSPCITQQPELDTVASLFRLHARFANEPVAKELVFEWRPSKGLFRTRRGQSLRTTPYTRERKYSLRLTPATAGEYHH